MLRYADLILSNDSPKLYCEVSRPFVLIDDGRKIISSKENKCEIQMRQALQTYINVSSLNHNLIMNLLAKNIRTRNQRWNRTNRYYPSLFIRTSA
ncbi:hypothetical protein BLNAU_23193 [Blattamonas nauphoetae]|uniref:Uncharacterized protein n=1 Tax=Blattamonas nauphoetae TaxID=2049346 RepID=A0ABQ9WQX0_9EUKA|nr:hypothetical protein BLNAU_23193 [Blattamonas nauphoetae]